MDDQIAKLAGFDVTLFMGVFYHLPYPVKAFADLCMKTKETIIVDTAIRNDIPEDCLAPKIESTKPLMSGVDGLSWHPGGPILFRRILKTLGFEFIKVTHHVKDFSKIDQRKNRTATNIGRMRIIASRERGVVEDN